MPNAALDRATLAKATRRLLPFLFLLYLVCFPGPGERGVRRS